jgi:hypothetical protein
MPEDKDLENKDLKKDLKRRFSSRKLHIAIIGFVSATCFFYAGMLPPDLWVEFIRWIFAVYAGANVGEHLSKALEKRLT